jgi:hypothetical protein
MRNGLIARDMGLRPYESIIQKFLSFFILFGFSFPILPRILSPQHLSQKPADESSEQNAASAGAEHDEIAARQVESFLRLAVSG